MTTTRVICFHILLSYPGGPEHSSIAETQKRDLATNYMRTIEVFKEEINKSLNPRKTQTIVGNE